MTAQVHPEKSLDDTCPETRQVSSARKSGAAGPINLWDERSVAGATVNRGHETGHKESENR